MKLSQVLAPQVSNRSRARGSSYLASGAVRDLTDHGGIIEATVQGSELYGVWLEPAGAQIHASCTCPYFVDHVEICKHIWAVVLAAERQAIPLLTPGVDPNAVDLEPLLPDDLFDELDGNDSSDGDDGLERDDPDAGLVDEDDRRRPALGRRTQSTWAPARPAAPPRPRRPEPPSPWRQLLSAVSPEAAAPPVRPRLVAGQLLYVIDVAASTTSGALVLELMTRERKINGEWGKPRTARVTPADVSTIDAADEREILQRLMGARPHLEWASWSGYGQELSRCQVRGVLATEIARLACATGRCMMRAAADASAAKGAPLVPLAWDAGPAWTFTLGIQRAEPDSAGYVVEGWLARDTERMELAGPVLLLADNVLVTATHAARLDHGGAFAWLSALRRAGRVAVPDQARADLADALLVAGVPLATAPEDLRIETVQGRPRPRVRLRPTRFRRDRLLAELAFDYDGAIVAAGSPRPVIRSADAARAICRDAEAERRALDTLHQRGFRTDWSHETGQRVLQLPSHLLPRAARQLLEEGWHVEAAGRTYRQPGAAFLQVRSGIDWFELHGHLTYDDQRASLPELLAALDRGDAFVTLGDGTIGLLPEEWLRKHAAIARLGSRAGDHVRFGASQVALLDALIAAQPDASWDDTFARARTELRAFEGIQPADPPPTFTGTLRGYQRDGLGWLTFLRRFGFGGCLADDMGLGKTVMVLALLAERHESQAKNGRLPSLVVAPRSVVFNWRQEAARFAPGLRVLDYTGTGRAALRSAFGDHDLVLTTYGTLRRDVGELAGTPFDYVVLDEAQAIKNASSVSAKSTRLLKAQHRLALSGTPIENHLGELWSLFEFLNPGLLHTAAAFERIGAGRAIEDEAVAQLARGLRPFILRRTKDQVAPELPPKTEQTLYCELERPQRALYDELRDHYRRALLDGTGAHGFERAKLHVLEALLRLRQAACHPGLIDRRRSQEASAKLDLLVPRLTEAVEEGHKTLVFSQFTSLLAILRARLDEAGTPYAYLDGRTRDREPRVARFQTDPTCRLFLISLKAGGLGLNLTAAEYVFLLDPWWNPAVEAQAIDRAHRIGQARHVFAYRLIARDTVEERVLELQQRKRRLADAILTADNSLIRSLRREDLELLLS